MSRLGADVESGFMKMDRIDKGHGCCFNFVFVEHLLQIYLSHDLSIADFPVY